MIENFSSQKINFRNRCHFRKKSGSVCFFGLIFQLTCKNHFCSDDFRENHERFIFFIFAPGRLWCTEKQTGRETRRPSQHKYLTKIKQSKLFIKFQF